MKKVTIQTQNTETCIVCDEEKDQGIHLFTHFICETCEEEIRLTDPQEDSYQYYLQKLRKIKMPTIS